MLRKSVLMNFPRYLGNYKKQYIYSSKLIKCFSVSTSPEVKFVREHQNVLESKRFTTGICSLQRNYPCLNHHQALNFSVSSNLQSKETENHSKLWSAERLLSVGLLGVAPAAIMMPCQPLDCILAVALVMHTHWGVEAAVVDYVRPILFGPVVPIIAHGLVYAMSVVTLVGLFYLIFDGTGFVNSINLLWKL